MVMKKMQSMGFVMNLEPKSEPRARQAINRFPTLLNGEELKAAPLPRDFDTSVHRKLKASGVKATSLTEMWDAIETLKKRKLQVG